MSPRRLQMCVVPWLLACALLPLAHPAGAHGASAPTRSFQVTRVDTSKAPTIRVAFLTDDNDSTVPAITVLENGTKVGNVNIYPGAIGQRKPTPRAVVMLAIDASDSMAGAKIVAAKAAALALVDQARTGDRIGVVSFGADARVVIEPTEDLFAVRAAIHSLDLSPGTRMNDGVKLAVEAIPDDVDRSAVVLLSDGADSGSSASASDAADVASAAGVEVHTVALLGGGGDPDALARLSRATGGGSQQVRDAAGLTGLYSAIGRALLRSQWLEFHSTQPPGTRIDLVVAADGFTPARRSFDTPAHRSDAAMDAQPLPPAPFAQPAVRLPQGRIGAMVAALPFALLATMIFTSWRGRRRRSALTARLQQHSVDATGDDMVERRTSRERGIARITRPMIAWIERTFGSTSMFARLRHLLEQANLPLRESELALAMVGCAAVGMLVGLLVSPLGAALLGLAGLIAPFLWVRRTARRRIRAFELQLPDMLGMIASSLLAGHSFNQALAGVARDTPDPTAHEINRVLAEARLGMKLDDSLESMARRLGSADFDFAVSAVSIQRAVGGSLAEILEMVGETVRHRQQFRAKVKALTSMGTMSARVLLALPVFMVGVLTMLNREYMRPLLTTQVGHVMLATGVGLMVLGWASCRKIVAVKV